VGLALPSGTVSSLYSLIFIQEFGDTPCWAHNRNSGHDGQNSAFPWTDTLRKPLTAVQRPKPLIK
ncbi:MAG: hypothetical protein ACXVB1_13280, partial [Pseudobdellovibrionaceae bacterium]